MFILILRRYEVFIFGSDVSCGSEGVEQETVLGLAQRSLQQVRAYHCSSTRDKIRLRHSSRRDAGVAGLSGWTMRGSKLWALTEPPRSGC